MQDLSRRLTAFLGVPAAVLAFGLLVSAPTDPWTAVLGLAAIGVMATVMYVLAKLETIDAPMRRDNGVVLQCDLKGNAPCARSLSPSLVWSSLAA